MDWHLKKEHFPISFFEDCIKVCLYSADNRTVLSATFTAKNSTAYIVLFRGLDYLRLLDFFSVINILWNLSKRL